MQSSSRPVQTAQENKAAALFRRLWRSSAPLTAVGLALGPFRGLIKDYQMLVDSHMKAIEEGRGERIQAIDMGRRGLHDEGAALLTERLAGKIRIDHDTARRLFTLVCVLHQRV